MEDDPRDELHQWEQQERMIARLGCSYNHRREPRVRVLLKAAPSWIIPVITIPHRTKRAALRRARALRDNHGETRALRVWKDSDGWWIGASLRAKGAK